VKANAVSAALLSLVLGFLFDTVSAAEPQRVESTEQSFATAVQADGDVIVAGAPAVEVDGEADRGRAHVYMRDAAEWTEAAQLFASDGAAGERFGEAVAVDGSVIAVAAPLASVGGVLEAGVVYVFERDAASAWREVDRLVAEEPTTTARFGSDIGLDGERLIVSAPGADEELGESRGAAYIFDRDASGSWRQTAKLKQDTNDFAAAVDISGDVAALTANGPVSIYEFDGAGWNLAQTVAGSDFDITLQLEDDVLVIADPDATLQDQPGIAAGQVNVFERTGNTWEEVAALQSPAPLQLDRFGHDIDLNDGLLAIANRPESPDHLSLFMKDANGDWSRVRTLDADDSFPDADQSLAVSAEALVTGGPHPSGGFIHIFDMTELLGNDGGAGIDTGSDRDFGFGIASVVETDADDDGDVDAVTDPGFGSDLDSDTAFDLDQDVSSDIAVDSGTDSRLDSEIDTDTDAETDADASGNDETGGGATSVAAIDFGNGRSIDDEGGGGSMGWWLALLLLWRVSAPLRAFIR